MLLVPLSASANFSTTRKATMKAHQKRPEVDTTANNELSAAPLGLNVVKVPSLVSLEETSGTMKEEFDLKATKTAVPTKHVVIASQSVESLSLKQSLQAAVGGSAEEGGDTAGETGIPTEEGATAGAVTTKRKLKWTSELVRFNYIYLYCNLLIILCVNHNVSDDIFLLNIGRFADRRCSPVQGDSGLGEGGGARGSWIDNTAM